MAFFAERGEVRHVNDQDLAVAVRLHETIVHRCRRRGSWRKSHWADEVRLLRASLTEDADERIEEALAWYERHCKDSGAPPIFSAAAFRRHFDWLEERVKKTMPSILEVSDAAIAVHRRLQRFNWPKVTKEQLLQAIEASLRGRSEVIALTDTVYRHAGIGITAVHTLCDRIRRELSPSQFCIENWMAGVFHRVKNWHDWSGNLRPFVLTIDSKDFQKQGRQWAKLVHNERLWDTFMERVNECK